MEKMAYEVVWKRIEEINLINAIRTRQKKWMGYVLREDTCLLREVLEEKMAGGKDKENDQGQRCTIMNVRPYSKENYETLKGKARDKEEWRR